MNVIITGERGFVGSHLRNYLEERGYEFDRSRVAEVIINLASKSDVEKSIESPYTTVLNNVGATLDALEKAREDKPKLFIQFSTVEVYGLANPYAASKSAQDAIATAYAKTYDVPVVITTTNNIVGERQKGKFIPMLIEKIKKQEPVQIYTDNGTMGYRVYNPIENVCSAIEFIMQREYQGLTRYHLSGGQELSNLEIAQKIAGILGTELDYELVEASTVRPGYTRHLQSDGIRLEDLGWKPPVTLDEGLSWIK